MTVKLPVQPPNSPDKRQHAKTGSLANMPTQEQLVDFKKNKLPGIQAGIQKAWRLNQHKVRQLNGKVRFVDQG